MKIMMLVIYTDGFYVPDCEHRNGGIKGTETSSFFKSICVCVCAGGLA